METQDLYPIGDQSFESIRERGLYYIDKTEYIRNVVQSGSQYIFLGRPRRFGKSLFLSSLKCFYEGKRELFKGLNIDSMDWDWEPWPLIRLDLTPEKYTELDDLESVLNSQFRDLEARYGVEVTDPKLSARFREIIKAAHEKTGKKVVILVDEYDKPLVRNLNCGERFEFFRSQLAAVYSNFKSSADHIRLVFLTGVSRFSRLNIFSDLNNVKEITFNDDYAGICGISEKELHGYFKDGVQRLADKYGVTYEDAAKALKSNYDGYRFAANGSDMYNPWSLFCALSQRKIGNFWNRTGLPTIVAESLRRLNVDLRDAFSMVCSEERLTGLDLLNPDPAPLLYQAGYLTIKDAEESLERTVYALGIPNKEVKEGLFNLMLPYYVQTQTHDSSFDIDRFVADIKAGRAEEFMKRMESYFASMPFKLRIRSERDLQNVIYIFISLVGLQVKAEEMTSDGAIDITIQTADYIYLIELKYNRSARAALDQINEKGYELPFAMDGRKLIKIGANFSSRKRRIDDILVE